jgi:hypothetical protein
MGLNISFEVEVCVVYLVSNNRCRGHGERSDQFLRGC